MILDLLNKSSDNISFLTTYRLNTAVATIVHKGKGRLITEHKSHRLVRVSNFFGRLIDEHLRPFFLEITRPHQSPVQYGYTTGVSYLLAALQRHETEKFCVDTKKTFVACTLDGVSAFDIINRKVQTRELYCAGESG